MDDTGRRRLWIGNLDERISEFCLLKLLQKYGKIEQFDFLFHKSGPNQGKPRGYCFVSFEKKTDAVHALHALDGKLALGKKLAVKWAHSHIKAPNEPVPLEPVINLHPDKIPSSFGGQSTKVLEDTVTTKKRIIKTSVEAQIRAIEGKLRDMERSSTSTTFKPVPVYVSKKPAPPTEITEKCLPSLMSLPVELPTTTSSSSSSSLSLSSSTSSSASPPTTVASQAAEPTSSTSPQQPSETASSTEQSSSTSLSSASASSAPLVSSSSKGVSATGTLKSEQVVVKHPGKSKQANRAKPYDRR
ncbi:uncharacterized protein [Diadema setosum]|uniref:uncharacterized protein n=1 Tax=Diadema setosum TaxID=31175 RepID=UPI003B3A5BE6